jgi:hypothetical protein
MVLVRKPKILPLHRELVEQRLGLVQLLLLRNQPIGMLILQLRRPCNILNFVGRLKVEDSFGLLRWVRDWKPWSIDHWLMLQDCCDQEDLMRTVD